MKNATSRPNALVVVMLIVLVLSTVVYVLSFTAHLSFGTASPLEMISYLAAYFLTDICLCFAVYEVKYGNNHKRSLWTAFVCMGLRMGYDILSIISDGLYLPGHIQMDAFLVLDAAILLCIVCLIKTGRKTVNIMLVVLTAIYAFGEVAGYPMKSFDDLDEFVLMAGLLVVFTLPLLKTRNTV